MKKILLSIVLMSAVIEPLSASLVQEDGGLLPKRKSALDLLKAARVSDNCIEELEEIQREQQKEGSHKETGLDVWGRLLDEVKNKRQEEARKNQAKTSIK